MQQGHPDARQHEGFKENPGDPSALPQPQEAGEAAADGWDFEDSALDGLGDSQARPRQTLMRAAESSTMTLLSSLPQLLYMLVRFVSPGARHMSL